MKTSKRAFTLLEVSLAGALFTLFMLVGYSMLRMAEKVYHQVSGNEDATMQLKRAVRMLEKDLMASNIVQIKLNLTNVPPSLAGGASDGSGLCLLSASQNGSGDMVVNLDGEPFWQRNIIYYTVVPQGDPCNGGADAAGFDDRCPHKLLIRKVIDEGPATTPTANQENPIAPGAMTGFLTRPAGPADISNMNVETGLKQAQIVAHGLVSLQVQTDATKPGLLPNEVSFTVTAFNQPKSKKLAVGTVALTGQPGFLVNSMSVFPRNNR